VIPGREDFLFVIRGAVEEPLTVRLRSETFLDRFGFVLGQISF
jgi:hypothetical protein